MENELKANDPNAITLFAQTNFRNQQRRFGIKLDDRRRHMYVIGKTGMGKTTLLENMILSDIYAGHGCAYIDPHGDTAEKILDFIPSWRINDVVYFNPGDMEFPVGFNILETVNDEQKHLVGSGLMNVFKKIWPDVWSPRMEYILLNCVLALLDYPGATLLGINRLLVDKDYRQRVIEKIRDPIVKTFWVAEFASWSEKYATEAIAPVQNKVGQFLSASIIRNILAQVKSTINPRRIMDDRKIFIVNLSKGKIGEDNMRLLGGMIITKLQLSAMERVDMPEADRKDFFLYVDEFQNFATPAFANILSEARKYRLALILAHQYIEQLDETVRDAVFGNIGTILTFRIGSPDALFMEKEFSPTFIPEDLANLPKYGIYLKLMVDGVTTEPFSASTLPPIAQRTGSQDKVVAVSRERYATPRSAIEEKVLKWSGLELGIPNETPENVITGGEVSETGINVEALQKIIAPSLSDGNELSSAEERVSERKDPGEYLRFSAERLASIVKTQPQKKEKPKFKHTCTRCGVVWEMPVQLDPSRPMYCADCLPIVREDRKTQGKVVKEVFSDAISNAPGIQEEKDGSDQSKEKKRNRLEMTMKAFEDGVGGKKKTHEPNRPRIVVSNTDKAAEVFSEEEGEDEEERSELIDAIAQKRGSFPDTQKKKALPPKEQVELTGIKELFEKEKGGHQKEEQKKDDGTKTMARTERSSRISERFDDEQSQKRKKRKRNRSKRNRPVQDALRDHFSGNEQVQTEKKTLRDLGDAFKQTERPVEKETVVKKPTTEIREEKESPRQSSSEERSSASSQTVFKQPGSPSVSGGMRVQPGQKITFDS